jgi:hypothetical protein
MKTKSSGKISLPSNLFTFNILKISVTVVVNIISPCKKPDGFLSVNTSKLGFIYDTNHVMKILTFLL